MITYRYTLRTLFIIVTAAAVASFAIVNLKLLFPVEKEEAIDWLKSRGVLVFADDDGAILVFSERDLEGRRLSFGPIRELKHYVRSVGTIKRIGGIMLTDSRVIEAISSMQTCELILHSCDVTPEIIRSIQQNAKVCELSLVSCRNVPEFIRSELQLPISKFSCVNCNLTDSDLRDMSSWSSLKSIDVSRNDVGDEGIQYLLALPKIERIEVTRTRVTDFSDPRVVVDE